MDKKQKIKEFFINISVEILVKTSQELAIIVYNKIRDKFNKE